MSLRNLVMVVMVFMVIMTQPVYADEIEAVYDATSVEPLDAETMLAADTVANESVLLDNLATDGQAAQNTPGTAITTDQPEETIESMSPVIEASLITSNAQVGPGFINLPFVEETVSEPGELIWMGWTVFESGDESYAQTGGDGGHAFGRFQFDSRYDLAGFLQKCINYDVAYARFGQFITTKSGQTVMRTRSGLSEVWKQIYSERPDEFSLLQIEYAAETYYYNVKMALLNMYGINIDEYSPVLKGTMWSIALRDGNNVHAMRRYNNLRTVVDTYVPGIDEETWLRAIYAAETARHPSQSGRWSNKQLNAALSALSQYQQIEVASNSLAEFEVIVQRKEENTIIVDGADRGAFLFFQLFFAFSS